MIQEELRAKDHHLRRANERIDRLTEAMASKQHIPLIMPQAELPKFQAAPTLEKSSGWFDNKPIPAKPPSGATS